MSIYLDLESGPLSPAEREPFKPEFAAAKNIKDPEKIKAAIAEKERAFEEEAALSSLTGKVLCVGMWTPKKEYYIEENQSDFTILHSDNESDVIQATMDVLQSRLQNSEKVVGHFIKSFDLPFLVQRAFRLGIHVPMALYEGRWWNGDIIDLNEVWNGPGSHDRISLDHLAKALGVGAKNGSGKDFANLWNQDREAALKYLSNDIELTRRCAEKMGVE